MKTYKHINGTSYRNETPDEVIRVLESARQNRTRLHISLGETASGRDWLEEFETHGYVGRSMGPVKVPLLVANTRSLGGGAILDIGYHAIDMVHFLTNAPLQTISCNLWVGDRPAAGDELETAATLFGRAGPTWVKVVIDRHGKKSERVAARGRQVWEADRATVSCDGEIRFSCPESWDLALRGQLVTLMIACSSPVSPVSLWDHLMGLRVVEQARSLSRIQGLADCGGQS